MTGPVIAVRRKVAMWLDDRPRVRRYARLDGSWFAVDTEGNVWSEAWRAPVAVAEEATDA